MSDAFQKFAGNVSKISGSPTASCFAFGLVLLWGISGPAFGFSDTWQLIINTGTTIVTFIMVFLIQNAQNRDTLALQLKLDELLRCMKGARIEMVEVEKMDEEELTQIRQQFEQRAHAEAGASFREKQR